MINIFILKYRIYFKLLKSNIKYLFIFILSIAIVSCSNTKYLTNNQTLYVGAKLSIEKNEDVRVHSELKDKLKEVFYPQENTKVLGLKIPLAIYNRTSEPEKKKGIKYYFKYKLGEEPVFYDFENTEKVLSILKNRLEVNGYFNSEISYKVITKKKRTKLIYKIHLKKPYIIDTVIYNLDNSKLSKYITKANDCSVLNKGDIYTLEKIKEERDRINKHVRNLGYFNYRKDNLIYKADTLNNKISFTVEYKNNISYDTQNQYRINNINVYAGFNKTDNKISSKSVYVNNINYHYNSNLFIPKKILKNVFFAKDSLYADIDYRKTLAYYYSLNILSLVSVSFNKIDTVTNLLDVEVQLLRSKKNSVETKFTGFTKSNGFSGPSVETIFSNKNILRGAEQLSFSAEIGIEKQFSGGESSVDYIFRIALNSSIKFPNYTPALKKITKNSVLLPYSYISTGVTYLRYKPSMDILQTNLYYGYKWFPSKRNSWIFKPFAFVYQKQYMHEGYNDEDLIDLPYVPYGMNDQFSLGSEITYTISTKKISKTRNEYFFKSTFDVAGNLMFLLFENFAKQQVKPYSVLGQPFAQYTRIEFDTRYFRKLKYSNKIATRLITFFSIPYGNSTELPFFKKYFIGGPNSVRGFNTGSIGPGSYYSDDNNYDLRINNGDIRLEANIEYRFKIAGYFFGGLFLDAGNVWLTNADSLRPGGEFETTRFYKEIAIATGFGLRMDFSVIAIRLDLGMPLRKPNLPEDERWIFKSRAELWRKNLLVLHFAIDYPF